MSAMSSRRELSSFFLLPNLEAERAYDHVLCEIGNVACADRAVDQCGAAEGKGGAAPMQRRHPVSNADKSTKT